MNTIDKFNFSGMKVLIRVDFNVPLDESFHITDDTRIRAALPTINKVLGDGGSVILMSHLGRPKGGYEEKFSLKHIIPRLSELLNAKVHFADDCIGEPAKNSALNLGHREVLLLENLRFHKEEKKGDEDFARQLASLTTPAEDNSGQQGIYINDAFGTAHRAHASTTIVAKFFPENKMFGYLITNELKNIDNVLNNTEHPFTAILGGAKVSGKIEVINNLMTKVDNMIIGGGMAYTFTKALGGNIGNSIVEDESLDLARNIIDRAKQKGIRFYLPSDAVIADAFSNDANVNTSLTGNIPDGWMGLDIGKDSCEMFADVILRSRTILWNGPMGVFEMSNYEQGTKHIARAVVKATKGGSFSLIGGGDTVAAINKYGLADNVSYVSTGGGALLEYMEGKELPGIKAILGT
ncbi:MAG: phosphoglycerate kinase [Bacteroidota bacterium]